MNPAGVQPYVIGQWVCGRSFYGRKAILERLSRPGQGNPWHWIAGLRRIGKTSLLKELELRAGAGPQPCLPLFWDLQGADGPVELALGFSDALLDAEPHLDRLGIPLAAVEDTDLVASLTKVLSELERRGGSLMLLCDEVEDHFAPADERGGSAEEGEGVASELWRILEGSDRVRVVIASSLGLCEGLAAKGSRRPPAHCSAPRFLGPLTDSAARALLLQDQLPADRRPPLGGPDADTLLAACGNHPMLLQMAGKLCLELGDAGETLRRMAADRAVRHLLAVDFDLLSGHERALLADLARGSAPVARGAERLLALGVVERSGPGPAGERLEIANRFLARWLLTETS